MRITGWGEGLEEKWVCKVTERIEECVKVGEEVCEDIIGWEDG